MHVGRQQGGADLLQGLGHIFFGQFAHAAEIAEGVAEFFGKRFEHGESGCGTPVGAGKTRYLRPGAADWQARARSGSGSIWDDRVVSPTSCPRSALGREISLSRRS